VVEAGRHVESPLIRKGRPVGMSDRNAGRALGFYCASDDYLEALSREGARRIALDGTDAGVVEEEHRLEALARLEERAAKRRAVAR
jgi:sRNA-binding protein